MRIHAIITGVASCCFLAFAFNFAWVGCTTNTRITKQEAICIAVRLFPEKRYGGLENYEIGIQEDEDKELAPGVRNWLVSFQGKGEFARPGGYCLILINQKTGKHKIVHGI